MSGVGGRGEPVDSRYLEEATTRLLAEVVIATRAVRLVSTKRSFVGKVLKALSRTPDEVRLLQPNARGDGPS